jgi:uncharacterized protein (DUF2062 family)
VCVTRVQCWQSILSSVNFRSTPARHTFLYRRVALPFFAMLRMGASPRSLAWSISLGVVIGINPLLGSTTLLCLGIALLFQMNLAASQLANHLMYPLEVLLVVPFLRLGACVFHTPPIPLSPRTLFDQARAHPIALMQDLWVWEWHALVLWAALSAVLLPSIAAALTPVLRRVLQRVEAHQYPLVPTI